MHYTLKKSFVSQIMQFCYWTAAWFHQHYSRNMSYLITRFISDHLMYSQSYPHTINYTLPVINTTSAYLKYIIKQQSGLPLLANVNNSSNNWYLHLLSTSKNVAMQTVLIRSPAISATGKQHIGTLMMATTIKWCTTETKNCSACTFTQIN
jgi:hypothetical protein